MKNFFPLVAACAFAASTFMPTTASAQTPVATDQHVVTVTVPVINMLEVGGDVGLTLGAPAAAGLAPSPVQVNSAWSLTTNGTGLKVTASTADAFPGGLALFTRMAAPSGATSQGFVSLGAADLDIVTGISSVAAPDLVLTYRATATAAVPATSYPFTVVYTLVAP